MTYISGYYHYFKTKTPGSPVPPAGVAHGGAGLKALQALQEVAGTSDENSAPQVRRLIVYFCGF